MVYKVSVFKRGKSGPELVEVANVTADDFTPDDDFGASFWRHTLNYFTKDVHTLVAHFPPAEDTSWIVEET